MKEEEGKITTERTVLGETVGGACERKEGKRTTSGRNLGETIENSKSDSKKSLKW